MEGNDTMESRVGERLAEKTDSKIIDMVYADNLKTEFPETFQHILSINRAHVIGLSEGNVISRDVAATILNALDKMEETGVENVPLDPELEESYFNHEAWVINEVGIDIGGRMHIGRSRNDLGATVDRLKARRLLLQLLKSLAGFRKALLNSAEKYSEVVMPGYTHMQPAQPMSFGYYLAAIASASERDFVRLLDALDRINTCPLGAAALTGTSFPIDSQRVASLLGFRASFTNGLDAVAARDFLMEASSAAGMAATTCSRMAQDFHLMVTDEFSTLTLSDSVSGTSSIMPQKKNPFLLEYIRGIASQISGASFASNSALIGKNYTVAIDTIREDLRGAWSALTMADKCFVLSELIVNSLKPKDALMLKRAQENYSTVTDLADLLVVDANLSFREAHHVVGYVVRTCMDKGLHTKDINQGMVNEAAKRVVGKNITLSAEKITACLDPVRAIASRVHRGGASPAALRESVRIMQETLDSDILKLEERQSAFQCADTELRHTSDNITGKT